MRLALYLLLPALASALCTTKESCLHESVVVSQYLPEPWRSAFSGLRLDKIFLDRDSWGVESKAPTTWCPHNAAYEFIPATAGILNGTRGSATNWTGADGCFQSLSAQVIAIASSSTAAQVLRVRISGSGASGSCRALYAVGTSYKLHVVELTAGTTPSVVVDVNLTSADAATDVEVNGLTVFLLPCGAEGSLESILATAALFIGSDNETSSANAAMLAYRGVWPTPFVPFGRSVPVDEAAIPSGTYLSIMEFTGTGAMQALGTGPSGTSHSAVAVWRGGKLFVTESTHNLKYYGNGIMATEWSKWWATDARIDGGRMIALLVLEDKYRAAFNETAFWDWFDTVKGTPYGFNNYIFSVLDTADPFASFPLPIDNRVLTTVLNAIAVFLPKEFYNIFVQPLNQRLGTSCNSLACVTAAVTANKAAGRWPGTLAEATSIPEADEWRYEGNVSLVCSAFAAYAWKVALGPMLPPLNATEQVPRDNFMLGIFNGSFWNATNCPGGLLSPDGGAHGTACQASGQYELPLGGYNSLPPYAAMNSHCGSQWPKYARCPGGGSSCQC